MADYFDQQPNFTNPAYASPEQLAQQRAYAAELLKRSGQDVNRPTGALANMIDALTSQLQRNNANQIQSQAAAGNAGDMTSIIKALQSGQNPDAATMAHLGANPLASPEQRAFVGQLTTPQTVESPYKQPAYSAPGVGLHAPVLPPNYQPGAPFAQGTEGNSISGVAPPPPPVNSPSPAVQPTAKVWGDKEAQAAGLYPPANPPAGTGNAFGNYHGPVSPEAMNTLRDYGIKSKFLQEQGKAKTAIMTADLQAGAAVPQLKNIVTTMIDDVETHGKDWTMGPSAEISLQAKRLAANYAPGFMKDQLNKIASAESFSKMSATLAGATPGVNGSTDAQLVNRIESNPGLHNTVGGASGLLKMRLQMLNQQQDIAQLAASTKDPDQFIALRQKYFDEHPLINPMTNHPLRIDMKSSQEASGGSGGFKVLKVH